VIAALRSGNRRLPDPKAGLENWRWYFFGAVFVVLLGAGGAATVWMMNPVNMPLRSVRVDGEFRHLSADRLRQVVASKATGGFFSVDVQAIRAAVMADPWVRDVSVRRIWPDQLRVTIVEQRAIAYWRRDSLLNERGRPFRAPVSTFPVGLVQLAGPDGTEMLVLKRYQQLADWFRPLGLRVNRVELNDRRSLTFAIDGAFEVIVGRTDFEARVQRLLSTLPRASDRLRNSEVIDLRYTDGFAIRPRGTVDDDAG
jgi:cell division protein FtsQ